MIRVQVSQEFLSRIIPVVALKSLHGHARGVSLAQARGELHLAMDGIIEPDESADVIDDDEGRHHARGYCGDEIVAVSERKRSPCPGTGWPSTKMGTSEKIEAQIEVLIR